MRKNFPVQCPSPEQTAQRGCGASITEIFQSCPDTILCHVLQGWPFLSREVGPQEPPWWLPALPEFWDSESIPSCSIPCVIQNCRQQKKKKKSCLNSFKETLPTDTNHYPVRSFTQAKHTEPDGALVLPVRILPTSNTVHSLSTGTRRDMKP